ncbi:hypothetical protein KI387_027536, partial [Taxus chinensis]
ILRSSKDMEVAQNLLHISSVGHEEVSQNEANSTIQRLNDLEKEMMKLKEEVTQLTKQKGKRKIDEGTEINNQQVEAIYKKLNSLDNR